MKTEVTITDITHEDLVDLFSIVFSGNYRMYADVKAENYYKVRTEDDTHEDKIARVLLNGGPVYVFDLEAEDEDDVNGDPALPHEWDDDAMRYKVTLHDIEYGLGKALSESGYNAYVREYVQQFIADPCQVDLPMADAIMQYIVFGDVIYD